MITSTKVFFSIIGYKKADVLKLVSWLNCAELDKKCYYTFNIAKGNGKVRTISPSFGMLKDIQQRILKRIFNKVRFPYYVTGSLKGRSGLINAKLHSGRKFFLQTDLVKFFDNVSSKSAYNAFIKLGFSGDISSLLTRLTTFRGHLPQGPPTSPFIANLVGLSIDEKLITLCSENYIQYSRYVDDISFSSNRDFQDLVPTLLKVINECGYKYNHKKTVYKSRFVEMTGVRVGLRGMHPTKSQADKLFDYSVRVDSKLGIYNYCMYMKKIQKAFKCNTYKQTHSRLDLPQSIWPTRNLKNADKDLSLKQSPEAG